MEGMKLIQRGESNRSVAVGAPYQNSHVAHAVVTIHVQNKSLIKSAAVTAHSKLHIVDLAGGNLTKKPVAKWLTHQQVVNANLDRLFLGHYLTELHSAPLKTGSRRAFRNRRHSTLIHYLGDSLESSSVLRLIGHIIPDIDNIDSTLATMRFGEQMHGPQCVPLKFNTVTHQEALLQTLQEELTNTKKDLQIARMVANLSTSGYKSHIYVDFTEQFIEKFLHGETDEHTLLTNLDPKVTLQVFKDLHTRCLEEKKILDQRIHDCEEITAPTKVSSKMLPESISSHSRINVKRTSRKDSSTKKTVSQAEPQAVGEPTKSGISIGPGIASDFVGPATRDLKLKKARGSLQQKSNNRKR